MDCLMDCEKLNNDIFEYIINKDYNDESDDNVIKAAKYHFLQVLNSGENCMEVLVHKAFSKTKERTKIFKIIKVITDKNTQYFKFDNFYSKVLLYKFLIALFLFFEEDYKNDFTENFQRVMENHYDECIEEKMTEEDYLSACNYSKPIYEGSNEIWKFLNI